MSAREHGTPRDRGAREHGTPRVGDAREHGTPRASGARGDAGARPLLRLRGDLTEACTVETLGAIEPRVLAEFLAAQRWFGAKGSTPRAVRLHDVVPLVGGAVLARIAVDFDGRRAALYQVPLTARAAEEAGDVPERAVLARLVAGRAAGVLFDAVEDAGFREALLGAVLAGTTIDADGARWIAAPVDGSRRGNAGHGASRVVRAEQSNTSIIYGEHAILKLYRRLEAGENPDVEIGEFLTTRTSFRNVPRLIGTMRLIEPGDGRTVAADADATVARHGGPTVAADAGAQTFYAGMVQEYVAATGDGWEYALGDLERYLASGEATPPAFARDARRLGEITRGLHEALASDPTLPAFAPVPVSSLDLRAWLEAVGRSITTGLDLLETQWKQGRVRGELTPRVREIVSRRGEALAYAGEIVAGANARAGARIRHHGDLHLGQTLRTADGDFMIIDFEGEPARPLDERRRPHSPLRDAAGMLRSFDYAAAAIGARLLARAADAGEGATAAERERRSGAWRRAARDAFLAAYVGAPDAALPSFFPAEREDVFRLIALFEIEKAFYELAYELDNRPDWVAIPLAGILRLLDEAP